MIELGDLGEPVRLAVGLCQAVPSLAAPGQRAAMNDPNLAAVVAAWPELPEAVRAGIVAMVKAAEEVGRGS